MVYERHRFRNEPRRLLARAVWGRRGNGQRTNADFEEEEEAFKLARLYTARWEFTRVFFLIAHFGQRRNARANKSTKSIHHPSIHPSMRWSLPRRWRTALAGVMQRTGIREPSIPGARLVKESLSLLWVFVPHACHMSSTKCFLENRDQTHVIKLITASYIYTIQDPRQKSSRGGEISGRLPRGMAPQKYIMNKQDLYRWFSDSAAPCPPHPPPMDRGVPGPVPSLFFAHLLSIPRSPHRTPHTSPTWYNFFFRSAFAGWLFTG